MPKIAQKRQKLLKNCAEKNTKISTAVKNYHKRRLRCVHLFPSQEESRPPFKSMTSLMNSSYDHPKPPESTLKYVFNTFVDCWRMQPHPFNI